MESAERPSQAGCQVCCGLIKLTEVLCRQLEAAEELARLAARAELASCAGDTEKPAGATTFGGGKSMDTLREVAAECAAQVMQPSCPTVACIAELYVQQ